MHVYAQCIRMKSAMVNYVFITLQLRVYKSSLFIVKCCQLLMSIAIYSNVLPNDITFKQSLINSLTGGFERHCYL